MNHILHELKHFIEARDLIPLLSEVVRCVERQPATSNVTPYDIWTLSVAAASNTAVAATPVHSIRSIQGGPSAPT